MPIFDQGYQHWKGTLSGHAWRWLAITKQGVRGQLKGTLSIARLLLLGAMLPALLLVVVMAIWGLIEQGSESAVRLLQPILPEGVTADPHAYRHAVWTISYSIFFQVQLVLIMLLVVLVGPNLVSRDLRFNAFPLYFSRPLTRLDYFLGKLGVIAALVGAVAVLPAVAAYILGICFSLDLTVVRDTWRLLPASILYGLIIVVSAGTLMLALSSLSRRSLYVGIAWIGIWIVSATVSSVLDGIQRRSLYQQAYQEQSAGANLPRNAPHHDPDDPSTMRNRPVGGPSARTWDNIHQRVAQARAEAARTDWRPLCSYVANLKRLGEALLNTDEAWVEINRPVEAPRAMAGALLGRGRSAPVNNRRLADDLVPQYPWTWSAGVLAGLFGLSLWILSTRVKSLDRLR
jgi:ABC-2 type transport system permease protein